VFFLQPTVAASHRILPSQYISLQTTFQLFLSITKRQHPSIYIHFYLSTNVYPFVFLFVCILLPASRLHLLTLALRCCDVDTALL
jgi:hypothetical protein